MQVSKGLGATLSQKHPDNRETIIAHASRALTVAEEKYSTIERETLAVVWALEHFRVFIWGKECIVKCDHKPLVRLLATEGVLKASARIARMSMRLQDFIYSIVYVPGKENVTADFLSRMPLPIKEDIRNEWDNFQIALVHDEGSMPIGKAVWCEECKKYDILQSVVNSICNG